MDKQGLIDVLEPVLAPLGFGLVDIDLRLGQNGLLRLYIERAEASDDSVTLSDCEQVSEQVGAFLDVEDPLPGHYVLEVSSPGIDRRLRTEEHFRRFAGNDIRFELKRAIEGQRRFRGRLLGVEGDAIVVQVDDAEQRFRLADIGEARLKGA